MSKVSLVLATYHHAPYLEKTLFSIVTQTRKPDQIVVVEDGDDDGGATFAVCEKWKTALHIEHYRRVNRPKLVYSNQAIPLNCAIKIATGKILLIHDDACMFTKPTDIENLVRPVEENPNVTTYAVVKHLDRNGQNPGIEFKDANGIPTFWNYRGQAIRRDVVVVMGGIEESWIGYGGDDCNFRERLVRWNNGIMESRRMFDVEIYHQWHPQGRTDAELPIYHENSRRYERLSAQMIANEGRDWGNLNS
jgi:glycosyltransferase involved in cell wall biosynthesis